MPNQVSGFDETQKKLQAAMRRIGKARTERFITESLIAIAGRAATYTPIKTSALINSQYRRVYRTADGYTGEVGYGANYAKHVHDAPGTLRFSGKLRDKRRPGWGVYWGPNGRPEFLALALKEFVQQDLRMIIQRNYKL